MGPLDEEAPSTPAIPTAGTALCVGVEVVTIGEAAANGGSINISADIDLGPAMAAAGGNSS